MGAGWIAQGADTPAPAASTPAAPAADPWKPTAPDTSSVPALVRPHQDPNAHPIDNSLSLYQRSRDLLFGHEPSAGDDDKKFSAGILPSIGHAVDSDTAAVKDWATSGPSMSALASAYPHLLSADVEKAKAGVQETAGASQVQSAERQLAAYNVLPQVAQRFTDKNGIADTDAMAKDPLVAKTARSLGVDPKQFAGDYAAIAGLSSEQQADNAARAHATLQSGQQNVTAGKDKRIQAWADARVWRPSDLENGGLDPSSLKGLAFGAALSIPELAITAGATVAGTAVGGPAGGIAAGGITAAALFAPGQREDIKNKVDDQVSRILEKADALDDAAPVGGRRGLNPVTEQLRQQAADLAASSDKIANTAGFLYAVSDAAGALPVSAVLARSPAGKAVLDRIVGAAAGQTVGGRIAGTMVANGAGGMLQASIQKAVDSGIVHEQTSLSDALKDIAFAGVTSAITAAPIAAVHEVVNAPKYAREAQARRDMDSDELAGRVRGAADAMNGPEMRPGEDYPGYKWNPDTPNGTDQDGNPRYGRYEPYNAGNGANPNTPRLTGSGGTGADAGQGPPRGAPPGAGPRAAAGADESAGAASQGATGAAGQRAAYQSKVQALNEAAAAAEKRSDVSLEPEEEGWSVHVNGQPVAQFDTVEAAREAMAGARKVVGTKPAVAATNAPSGATKAPSGETTVPKTTQPSREPETELERTQPVQAERRSATELRQRVADMDPDQMKAALLTHELTGIPNRRAYEDSPKKPVQASVDVDSLKWINDNASHEGGDQLLKTVAQALHEETGGNAYHISGDEFVVQGEDHASTEAAMDRAKARLADATLTFQHPDGRTIELKGVGLSHGTGSSLEEAESHLGAAKAGRQAEGLRAGRGEQPPNASIRASEAGLSAGGGAPAAEVLGQEVARKPVKPTPAQAEAGNYFKPSVAWHGLPIKVENTKGQYRRFIDAKTGKPGKRQMRADYGYFPGTEGADEDGIDVMMGPHHDAPNAYVIDQLDHTGKTFDEHKVQVGVRSAEEAREQYLSHYPAGWKGLGGITELSPEQLKHWLKEGDLTQPIDPESVPRAKAVRGPGPDPRHDSLLGFLARHPRGLDSAEAEAQGIDPADMALSAAHVGIKRAFRKGGISFDHAAEALHEAGYPVADAEGHYSPNALLDKIDSELRGTKVYSSSNEAEHIPEARDWRHPLSDADLAKLTVADAESRLEQLRQEQERLEREIERAGLNEEGHAETEDELERIPFARGKPPGVQQDLFGAVVNVKNEIKRVEEALDKKRNTGQESVETGRPDDLFSQARKQADIEDRTPGVKTVAVSGDRPTTLYRGTETGTAGVKRESSGGEIGRAIYATPHRWLAESYGGGPKARPGAGRDVHEITLPKLPAQQYGYIVGGSIIDEKAKLVDHTGKVLHEYEGAKMSGAAERDAIRGIAEAAGIKVIVGDKESIGENQVAILDPALIAHRTVTNEGKTAEAKTGALEDAGEKIGGARKDKWAERGMRLTDLSTMTEAEAATLVNKKAVWNPNWQKLIDDGMGPKTAAIAKVIFDQLAARPRYNTPVGRRQYVEVLGRVRDMLLGAETPADIATVEDRLATELGVPRGMSLAATPEQKLAREKFWSIQKGRRSTLRVAYSDQRKAEKLLEAGWPAKKVKEDTGPVKDKTEEEGPPKRPYLESINRVGPPVRAGDVTSTDFIKTFGFRGLEFGNWAANDERQQLVNHAYEGLHDLARVLGIPPQALSLNGTMGLALGARGGGRFAAHYEPGKLVINMTKINGAGALAHEWGHALDHYFGETGRADAYTTGARGATGWYGDRRSLGHLRPEMQEAWEGVMQAMYKRKVLPAEVIRNSDLSIERAQAQRREIEQAIAERPADTNLKPRLEWIDRRIGAAQAERLRAVMHPEGEFGTEPTAYLREASGLGDYWRRPTEMFARAFESFIQDKIAAEGNQSEYLVHHAAGRGYPAADRPQINKAIQHLVDTLETKPNGDKEALFRRGATPAKGMTVPAVRATVDKIIEGFGVKPEVTVVRTLSDLNDHPEVGHIVRDSGNSDAVAFVHPRSQKIYMIADQIHGVEHAASVLAHEYVTHFGLRAAFGDRRNADYQAILNGVAKAMPAELRARGEQEFPGSYNPLNQHHRYIAAEEVLAYYGQQYANKQDVPSRIRRWLDKLHGMLRDWIRKVLGLPQKFDELFVKRTLADLESFLRRGSGADGKGSPLEGDPAFAEKQDTFFSGLAKAVDAAKREKGTGQEWEATLKNMPGVKAEEMQWVGLKDWLEGRGRVTKAEVADYVAAHTVKVGEVQHGGNHQQERLDDGQIAELNHRMAERGYGDLDPEQVAALQRGGQDTMDMIEALHRMGLDASDMYSETALPHEQVVAELREMGYQVHEDDVTGSPYLMQVDENGVANEVADGDVPAVARDLLDSLRQGDMAPVKYQQWATPGGKNYRELLMTLNRGEQPSPTHGRITPLPNGKFRVDAPMLQSRLFDTRVEAYEETVRLGRKFAPPNPEDYHSSHWDEKNVLAHVRFDDRTGPNGEKILHVHEIQSDWHQAGRRTGYVGEGRDPEIERKISDLTSQVENARDAAIQAYEAVGGKARDIRAMLRNDEDDGSWAERRKNYPPAVVEAMKAFHDLNNERAYLTRQRASQQSDLVPNAPFKTTWPELAMKRMLRMAAEGGYDALSWDTGDTNAERYNMSHQVDRITLRHNNVANTYDLVAKKGNTTVHEENGVSEEKLVGLIGKDAAQKAVSQRDNPNGIIHLTGDDLKVGGHGMRGFYDNILPKAVGKLVKKWGSSVEPGTVAGTEMDKHYVGPDYDKSEIAAFWKEKSDRFDGNDKQELLDVYRLMNNGSTFPWAMTQAASPGLIEKLGGKYSGALEAIPAHTVAITPAMRDSVLQGQPMFLKRRKGSSGAPPPAPKKGAYDMARRAIAAIPNSELNLSLRRIIDPVGVSELAGSTATRLRESLGELAQAREETLHTLEAFSKPFDLMATKDRYDFIHAMEEGKKQSNPELQPAADTIRKLLDDWREKIRGLGIGALDNFIENYFPHIWQDDSAAKKIFGQIFGRRPLKGPASFLKERTIPTTREGLDAGLKPISTNPLILAFAKLAEMQRFYSGVRFVQGIKDEKLAVFLPSHKKMPDGWVEINDAVGRVRQWSEEEQGFIERGKYIMPADAGRIVNNHLSASALRNFLPAQLFKVVSNAANALQLGFSGFHLGFTTLDAIVSRNAIGIERLLHGEPLKAAMAFLEAATGPGAALANIARGQRLRNAYSNLPGATPEMRKIVEGVIAAGGLIKMDNSYMAARGLSPFKGVGFATLASDVKAALRQPSGKVWAATQVLGSFPQEYATRLWRDMEAMWHEMPMPALTVPIEIAGRVTRASTSIIMEHIVPLQKLGVFSDLASDHIRRNPDEDPVAFANAMQKIWNTVDDRLGEMVYNNVFWNRTFKDVNHMMVRAVGWNLGTVRVLGGAPIDVVKLLDYMARGAPAELASPSLSKTSQARQDYEAQKSRLQRIAEKVGHKIPYALALVGTTAVVGAIMQYLLTGSGPTEIKDYFFPWTGRMTKYGTKERISLPSYMKDIYEYSTQPATTVINKANPIFGIMHAIYANEDFFGNAIRNPDDSTWRQMIQGAQYAAREVLPFSLQGTKQFVGAGEMDAKAKVLASGPYFGLTPAPARVTSPEQMDRYQLRETEKSYIRGLQRQLKLATEKKDAAEINRLRAEIRDSKLKERGTEHGIREDKVKAKEQADKISSLIRGRSRDDAAAALSAAGMPAFAALWRSLPDQPRPRVAESLESFA